MSDREKSKKKNSHWPLKVFLMSVALSAVLSFFSSTALTGAGTVIAILVLAAFIGLGIPAPLASLGSLISDGYKSLTMYPFLVLFPVLVLAMLMLSFNLMADGLRDAFDPKMKEM